MDTNNPILLETHATDYIGYFTYAYNMRFGDSRKIFDKVSNSNICNELLVNAVSLKVVPSGNEIVRIVTSSRYFMLSIPETVCLASFIVVKKLMEQINKSPLYTSYEWTIQREYQFTELCLSIIVRCDKLKIHSNKESFFDYFLKSTIKTHEAKERERWSDEDFDSDMGWIQ
ncbi:hypothetical protein LZQ00_06480 [Sphingobacterium sp. SRCM116780]|uniref:hypothetical protein n=1 Tax=Sphingobacterium sp. SRCM116780 TaxID=2907623 RepID=UPI001F2A73D3|nr:hypothetical protein [Sphingobacterium sp. SRCM116780]UIR57460.1 hypothetical protein LZQ00_06480 [Sphingobacterium sp. SRCM116780]